MAYLQGPYTLDPNLPTINVTGSPRHPSVHNDETGLGVFDDNALLHPMPTHFQGTAALSQFVALYVKTV